jgi:hypothetical protein
MRSGGGKRASRSKSTRTDPNPGNVNFLVYNPSGPRVLKFLSANFRVFKFLFNLLEKRGAVTPAPARSGCQLPPGGDCQWPLADSLRATSGDRAALRGTAPGPAAAAAAEGGGRGGRRPGRTAAAESGS